ncbi:MAG: phospholipid carrier-dependent glycosyltransferase [Cyanobacteria bacterium P01_A01_bin.45]
MTKKWFWIGITSIFLLSLSLRFWGLERFNTLVFDEIYYAKFAHNYIHGISFFDGHPPLGKYIIAIGMWLGNYLPFGGNEVNELTGAVRSPWSYRWINALFGSFIPLIIAGIAYQVSHRRTFALVAGLFAAVDGIFLVESRYALINQYIVIFGLLGQWCFLLALDNRRYTRGGWLAISGITFGCSIATKWNGLFFLLGVYLMWIIGWLIYWLPIISFSEVKTYIANLNKTAFSILYSLICGRNHTYIHYLKKQTTPLENLTQINLLQMLSYLGVIPVIVYSFLWIPHLQLNTERGLLEVHRQIWLFHNGVQLIGNSNTVHPYCAAWYKWPLLTRPMAYLYQTARTVSEPLLVKGPPLPGNAVKVIYDVHAMGNPFLWWFGVFALLIIAISLIFRIIFPWIENQRFPHGSTFSVDAWIGIYLVTNYVANLLPWVKVDRCVFIYHYMSAVVFAFLAIALIVEICWRSYSKVMASVGFTISFMIVTAFIFWLPIYLALPLSPEAYKLRMWFNSWI